MPTTARWRVVAAILSGMLIWIIGCKPFGAGSDQKVIVGSYLSGSSLIENDLTQGFAAGILKGGYDILALNIGIDTSAQAIGKIDEHTRFT